jgi:hypothetical protein
MNKYFIDTEFLEGKQDKTILGIKYGETKPTIDLISIGIVAEDGREYYAISKDFNLKEAWNRYDLKKEYPDDTEEGAVSRKVYWIRENVLKPIWKELMIKDNQFLNNTNCSKSDYLGNILMTYKSLKYLLNKYGKTNKQIAKEVKDFCYRGCDWNYPNKENEIEFYAYYADYDWVVFCQLFGKMINLPKGFPMYCIDLKQMLDEKVNEMYKEKPNISKEKCLNEIKSLKYENPRLYYPDQTNEHNALQDAKWNYELYKFLQKL